VFTITLSGKQFGRNGVLQYENGTSQPKFFDNHLIFFAYSNCSTSDTLKFNVARVNDAFVKLNYKDAQRGPSLRPAVVYSLTITRAASFVRRQNSRGRSPSVFSTLLLMTCNFVSGMASEASDMG